MKIAILVASAATLCLPSCQSHGKDIVELYDMAAPDGVLEIEMDRDGSFREMEVDISPDALPEAVKAAAMAKVPGGRITGAEREYKSGGHGWEVKLEADGRAWEVVTDDMAKVLETEEELTRDEAPAAVLAGADRAVSGGEFKSVERIRHGEATEYHVKKSRDGASFKVVLAPDGTVLRAVREQRAEIEIPLR